ncbi:MAG TPA: hypothetical protein DEF34_00715 [Desulfotomaculum sp.]|nr:hypothetical protein [Desulfotomaculum sp.]
MNQAFAEQMKLQDKYFGQIYETWLINLFTIQWWALLLVFIIPWVIWWKLVDKNKITAILCYGLIVSILSSGLDEAGHALHLWAYKYRLVPLCVELKPTNVSLIPVIYMLVYQYFTRWKEFIIATTIMAACLAFIGEPFLDWLDIYKRFKWEYIYSFPIYIAIAVSVKLLLGLITGPNKR